MIPVVDLKAELAKLTMLKGRTRLGLRPSAREPSDVWPAIATTLRLMTDQGRQSVTLSAGMMVVVPQNVWQQFEAPDGVCVTTATPLPTEHVRIDVEYPRTLG
jgi:mannose-6-phosphate isomerase-like protein (cupin superfamily)